MTSIPNYTKSIPKIIGNLTISLPPHCLKHCISDMLCLHCHAPNNIKKFQTIYHMLTDLMYMNILLKTILKLNVSLKGVIAACSARTHTLQYKIIYIHMYLYIHSFYIIRRMLFSEIFQIIKGFR